MKNIKKIAFSLAVLSLVLFGAGIAKNNVKAQSENVYSMVTGSVTAVDSNAGIVTLGVSTGVSTGVIMGAPCQVTASSTACPAGNNGGGSNLTPVTVAWGILAINANDQIMSAITQVSVGDRVTLYEKTAGSGPVVLYAMKGYSTPAGVGRCGSGGGIGPT